MLVSAVLAAAGPLRATDASLPTQQDGGGIPTTAPVYAKPGPTISPPRLDSSLGFSPGAGRFGRHNTAREFNRNDGGTEKPDEAPAQDDCKDNHASGNPVILGTGNKIEPELDFAASGPMPLYLKRTWNQHSYEIGLFGYHWISNFDRYLKFYAGDTPLCSPRPGLPSCTSSATATVAWAVRPNGRKIRFTQGTDGLFREDKASPVAWLQRASDGTWTLHDEDNGTETYSIGGYPLSVRDEAGIGWTFSYGGLNDTQLQRVTHSGGRYIQFLWTGDELREVRDPAGNSYRYTFVNQKATDGLHNIPSVTFPGEPATTVTYHYTDSTGAVGFSHLAGKSFNGVRYSTFAYSGAYATSTEHAGGVEKYTFAYTPGTGNTLSVVETNPLGKKTTYDFRNGKLMTITGQASANCPLTGRGNSYDANGNRDVVTDENGNVTNYDYNAKGQLLKLVEASGKAEARTTTYVWDTVANRPKSVTLAGQATMVYGYDTKGRLTSIATTNLSANGVANETHTTTFAYTLQANGLLATATVDGPLPGTGDAVTYTYSTVGDLLEARNSLGHATTYSGYNALGLPGRITGPNGDLTDYLYDPRGRVQQVKRTINSVVHTTRYYYDAMGHVILTLLPDGHWEGRDFDAAGRMTSVYTPEPGGTYARTRYTFNNASLPTRIDTERVSGEVLSGPPPAAAPTLTAPASSTNSSYTVSWSAVSGALTYQLEESINGGAWARIHDGTSNSRSFSNKPNGSYGYRARACTKAGCGPYSSVVTTVVNNPLPLTPALNVPAYSTGTHVVTWSSLSNATSYQLDEMKVGSTWAQVYSGAGTSLSRSKPSGDYSYRVRACNTNGCSAYSAAQTVTVEKEYCPDCLTEPPPPEEQSDPTQPTPSTEEGTAP